MEGGHQDNSRDTKDDIKKAFLGLTKRLDTILALQKKLLFMSDFFLIKIDIKRGVINVHITDINVFVKPI